MQQSIELTAKTVQEATKSAALKLGVAEDQVKVTVLEEMKGLFGKSTVRVRAEIVAQAAAPAAKSGGRGSKAAAAAPAPVEAPAEPEEAAAAAPAAGPLKRGRGRTAKAEAAAPVAAIQESFEPAAEDMQSAPSDEAGESEPEGAEATQEDAERLMGLLTGLLDSADLDVNAAIGQVQGRYVNIKLDGKDAAFLVGKHGEVLNAMQYLVNIIAGRKFNNGVRATLDGNDFRRRREEKLTAHAKMVADEVIKRGEEAVLDAMPAFDRRIVHKVLGEYSGISTYSEGEEPNRRVVIAPAD